MLALIGLVTMVRLTLTPSLQYAGPLILYFLVIGLAAIIGGFSLTLFSTLVSIALGDYFFIEPVGTLGPASLSDLMLWALFVLVGCVFGLAGERFLRARRRSDELMASLQKIRADVELNERTMRALLESSAQGIFGVDPSGTVRIANGAAHQMFGYLANELIGTSIETLIGPQHLPAYQAHRLAFFENTAAAHTQQSLHLQGRKKDGQLFPIETLITVTDTPSGPLGVSFVSDVTQRTVMEAALRRERAELHCLIEHTPVLISLQDTAGDIQLVNRSFARALGRPESELIGHAMSSVLPPAIADKIAAASLAVVREHRSNELEYVLEHSDGSLHDYHLVTFPLRYLDTDEAFGVGGFSMEITLLKQAEQKIRHAALHDPLTGLANRTLIYEMGSQLLSQSLRNKHKLAVMFFDLDRFKPINDTYGHQTGDLMLQEVARRLKSGIRSCDLVGRLGGDEFVAVLSDIRSEAHLESTAAQLLKRLSEPYVINTLELHTSPSIGISVSSAKVHDLELLIRQADAAMYHAKNRGRNNYQYFSDELLINSARVFALEQRLRRSLHEDDFELVYQPVVDMRNGQLVAVEGLIRWRQADGCELMPGDFIAAAEASGLIHQIGEWVLREACRQFERWQTEGLAPIRIAVNVSPVQFCSPDFRSRILAVLASTKVEPCWLELEVTETTVMSRIEEATLTLSWLKSLGLRIALDDFGTGYSSLSHLAHLPIDKLKVDQSFVTHIASDSRSLAIAETVIALGQKIGVEVVAEGIENLSALKLLRDRGCGLGQGYLIGRPMPPDQLTLWRAEREVEMPIFNAHMMSGSLDSSPPKHQALS